MVLSFSRPWMMRRSWSMSTPEPSRKRPDPLPAGRRRRAGSAGLLG